jgi:glycosyltransferase involved in cell wall biosynthesis
MSAIGPPPNRRNVLFVSGLQIHPTLSGGNLRSFTLASALGRQGLDVFVYSLTGRKPDYLARRPSSIQTWPEGIPEFVDRGPLAFFAQYGSYTLGLPPLWLTRYLAVAAGSPAGILLPALLREKLAWCDAVVADFPFVHPVFSAPSAQGRLRVLSTHNLEHQMYEGRRGWKSRLLRARVRKAELAAAGACDVLVTCCAADRDFFEAHAKVRRSVLVPNAVDLRRFRGVRSRRAAARQALGFGDGVKVFLFTASKWGPNREAFDHLVAFAKSRARMLAEQRIHILVVGSVTPEPLRLPSFTATGRVAEVEPYFAAADVALNPVASGAGTNVKMGEFLALRLPIVTTRFGARGFLLEDRETAFLFEKESLAAVLSKVSRLLDEEPERLRRMAERAYEMNEAVIDMDACVRGLVEAIAEGRPRSAETTPATVLARSPRGSS